MAKEENEFFYYLVRRGNALVYQGSNWRVVLDAIPTTDTNEESNYSVTSMIVDGRRVSLTRMNGVCKSRDGPLLFKESSGVTDLPLRDLEKLLEEVKEKKT